MADFHFSHLQQLCWAGERGEGKSSSCLRVSTSVWSWLCSWFRNGQKPEHIPSCAISQCHEFYARMKRMFDVKFAFHAWMNVWFITGNPQSQPLNKNLPSCVPLVFKPIWLMESWSRSLERPPMKVFIITNKNLVQSPPTSIFVWFLNAFIAFFWLVVFSAALTINYAHF